MSDEDLQDSLNGRIRQMISDQPELAVLAAIRLGWTVIPPDEENESAEDDEGVAVRS